MEEIWLKTVLTYLSVDRHNSVIEVVGQAVECADHVLAAYRIRFAVTKATGYMSEALREPHQGDWNPKQDFMKPDVPWNETGKG